MLQANVLLDSLVKGNCLHLDPKKNVYIALPEKRSRYCWFKRRATHEITQQFETTKLALETFNASLATHQIVDPQTLILLRKALARKISHIKFWTRGFLGWLYKIFRGRSEIKAMRTLKSEFENTLHIINRTESVALSVLDIKANPSPRYLFQMIQKEFPYAARKGPVEIEDFKITKSNSIPEVPFILTELSKESYQLVLPPTAVEDPHLSAVSMHKISTHSEFNRHLRQHIVAKKRLLAASISMPSSLLTIEDIRKDYALTSKEVSAHFNFIVYFFNPLTGKKESETLSLNSTMDKIFVERWVKKITDANQKRAEAAELLIQEKFHTAPLDSEGISFSWQGKYLFTGEIGGSEALIEVAGLGKDSYQAILRYKTQLLANRDYFNSFQNESFKIGEKTFSITYDSVNKEFLIENELGAIQKAISITKNLKEELNHLRFEVLAEKYMSVSPEVYSLISPLSNESNIKKVPGLSLDLLKKMARESKYDLQTLKTAHDGKNITPAQIFASINLILGTIKLYHSGKKFIYPGIPLRATDRKFFFDELESRLSHVIQALQKPEYKVFIPEFITNLGAGGQECAGRWKDETNKYYSMFCRPQVDERNVFLDQWFQHFFDQSKEGAVDKMVMETTVDHTGHVKNRYKSELKKNSILVTDWETIVTNDPFAYAGKGLTKPDDIIGSFRQKFLPLQECIRIKDTLNEILSTTSRPEVIQNIGSQTQMRLRAAAKEYLLPYYAEENEQFLKSGDREILAEILEKQDCVIKNDLETMIGVNMRGFTLLCLQTEKLILNKDADLLKFLSQFD